MNTELWEKFQAFVAEYEKSHDPDGNQTRAEVCGDLVGTILFTFSEGEYSNPTHADSQEFMRTVKNQLSQWLAYYPIKES